jgi:HK97 family phage portal protein
MGREKRNESLANLDARMDAEVNGISPSSVAALNLASVFNAATIRTNYLAMLPLITYYRDDKGNKEKFKTSPIYSLLHDKPSPLMTSYSWRTAMELHAIFYGGGFSKIERDILGRPIWLWLLDGRRMTARLTDNGRRLEWVYKDKAYQDTIYRDEDIIHIPSLTSDGITGEGVIRNAAKSLWLSMATETFGQKFFEQGLNPGGILTHPLKLSDSAFKHLKESFADRSKLVEAHKPLILEEGMTWNKITFSPEEAQFLGTRQFQDVEIARWFNLPLRMLKMPDASGLKNVEQIAIEMVQGTMLPRYVAWEQELNNKLFGLNTPYYAEFNVDGLLRGDSKTRADVAHIMRLDGALSANEWRGWENMNKREDEGGDEYWSQPNLAADKTNGDGGAESEGKPEEGTPADAVDIQQKAMNGAQVGSLVTIAQAVADGLLPYKSALGIILVSFPTIDKATAESMLKPADGFVAKKKKAPKGEGEPGDEPEGGDDGSA